MNAHTDHDLFGDAISTAKVKWRCLPVPGFMRAAKVPLPVIPPPRNGQRRVRVVDSFAGGGGATNAIEKALKALAAFGLLPAFHSLSVDYAINHDPAALAMHEANHPDTIHLPHNVWQVSMRETLGDDFFGFLWLSPDCRDHSPAKGGPITSRGVRDLAWVLIKWLKELPDWQRPWTICLENVGAFAKWSPLIERKDGKGFERDPERIGHTFHQFVYELSRYGYSVGWDELVACEYGSPTIRKRLKLCARRDAERIVTPKPTHAAPKSKAVASGAMKPWPVAADFLDFDIDCPSIFLTREEARAYTKATGKRIIRPLAVKTDARLAYGVKRHVLDAGDDAVIVTCNHAGDGFRGQGLGEPFNVVAASRDAHGLVMPHVAVFRGDSVGKPVTEPLPAVTANSFIKRPGGATPLGLAEATAIPFISRGQHGGGNRPAGEPFHTIAASDGDQNQVAAVYLAQHNTDVRRAEGVNPGRSADEPLSTLTVSGSHQSVVAAHMLSLKGSDRRDGSCDDPHPAVCAGGQHSAVVTLPLITAYYSTGGQHARVDDPSLTVPTKARFGLTHVEATVPPLTDAQMARARQVAAFLRAHGCWDGDDIVTLTRRGVLYVIIDIGMRMLTPRELARAQGFPDSYILDPIYKGKPLTETEQRHKIGNSVCDAPAAAWIEANYRPPLEWGREALREAA